MVPLLQRDARLRAVTLFADLQVRYPGRFVDGQVRTLERRVRQWRAVCGPSQPVIFPQVHPPGWQALLDFTDCGELGVIIDGEALPHRLGHVCCPHSGWRKPGQEAWTCTSFPRNYDYNLYGSEITLASSSCP